jgi:hypothetical protein
VDQTRQYKEREFLPLSRARVTVVTLFTNSQPGLAGKIRQKATTLALSPVANGSQLAISATVPRDFPALLDDLA